MTRVTNHAKKRIRQRIGSSNAEQIFGEALLYGIKQNETKGDLKRFLGRSAMLHRSDCVIYKGKIFWHKKTDLITVTPLPQKFFKYIPRKEQIDE